MLTDSQSKFIDAIVYDKRRSPMYYAKLTQAEKYRLSHHPKDDYEIVNIQLLGIKSVHKKNGKLSETSITPNSSTFSQIDERFPKRAGTSIPIKKKPTLKKSQIVAKAKPSYVKDFLKSETFVCVYDECPNKSFSREIDSHTYTKYSPDCLLNMDSQDSTNTDPSRQPPVISDNLCSAAGRSDTSYKNDHSVHTFQKFNKGPHLCPWQASNLSQAVVLSHSHSRKDGNAFKLRHKHEDREHQHQTDQLFARKEVEGHSSHNKTLTWETLKPPHTTSALAKTIAEDSHGKTEVEAKPSVEDYINTYIVMSPRMNEKSTNTKENFHHIVKERFCLPNNMYESSSSPAFYTDSSKSCREKIFIKHVCSNHIIEDVAPCIMGDQLEQPLEPAQPEELNESGLFGQDLEEEEKAEDKAKKQKRKKEGRFKSFFTKLSCRQKND